MKPPRRVTKLKQQSEIEKSKKVADGSRVNAAIYTPDSSIWEAV